MRNRDPQIIKGFAVMTSAADAVKTTTELAASTLELAGFKHGLADAVHVDDGQLGAAYGQPTRAMLEAFALLARTEGLLLDPVYSHPRLTVDRDVTPLASSASGGGP